MTDPTDSGVCPVIDATGRRPLEHSCCRKLAELESAHAAARDEWQVKLIEAETQARKLAKALEVCLNALEDVEYQCSSTDRRSCPWCQSDDWVWSQRLGRNALRHEDGCQRQEAIATAARALLGLAEAGHE